MSSHDAEFDLFRTGVSCAAVLEHLPPPWRLDKPGSTRRALKRRPGGGEIVIVNHDGRGWWDPQSVAKGDVFNLIQHLDPALNFGQVRQILRRFVDITPTYPEAVRARQHHGPGQPITERWQHRPRLCPGSPAWAFLVDARYLPGFVLELAAETGAVREGFHGSAWFAHRHTGQMRHIEVRGSTFKGALRGGTKSLFRFGRAGQGACRLVIAEAPIDALSLAAIEAVRADTFYVATGGGMGPRTIAALEVEIQAVAAAPDGLIASAADANAAGERHAELAATAGVRFERLAPTTGTDWNDYQRSRLGAAEIGILADIIVSGAVPVLCLTKVSRQAVHSRIITGAQRINQGMTPDLSKPEGDSDFYFVQADDPETAVPLIIEPVKTRIPQRFGLDPIRDTQVLCPMNRGGVGARSLNIELQAALNLAGDRKVGRFGWTFAPGNKVMQIENDYDKEVYNGDIGYIDDVDPGAGELTASFDGRAVTYGFGELDTLVPAYAAPIHKSQGSECLAVVIPDMTQRYTMLRRNLLYNGVTRGKRLVVLVGQRKAVATAVCNVSGRRRRPKLREWLAAAPPANPSPRPASAS